MAKQCGLLSAFFFACLVSTAVLTAAPAIAQPAGLPKLGPPPKGGGDALQRWCRTAVFYRYGFQGRNPGINIATKGPLIFMDADNEFSKTQLCVQTGGTTY